MSAPRPSVLDEVQGARAAGAPARGRSRWSCGRPHADLEPIPRRLLLPLRRRFAQRLASYRLGGRSPASRSSGIGGSDMITSEPGSGVPSSPGSLGPEEQHADRHDHAGAERRGDEDGGTGGEDEKGLPGRGLHGEIVVRLPSRVLGSVGGGRWCWLPIAGSQARGAGPPLTPASLLPAKLRSECDGVRSCGAIRPVLPCSFKPEDSSWSHVPSRPYPVRAA